MRFLVYGTGAVGGYFGARLAQAGREVCFVARGAHLAAIRRDGLRLESVEGDVRIAPANAVDTLDGIGRFDAVLVGVKSWQVADAARALVPVVGPDTLVVPLQNGVEAPTRLATVLGEAPVLGGLCGVIAYVAAPGLVRHVAATPTLRFGERDGRRSARVARLLAAFDATVGMRAEVPESIEAAMWEKFLLIASFSAVGAATRAPAGAFRAEPATRAMLVAAMREVEAVAHARGVPVDRGIVDSTLRMFDMLPADATASMQRDLLAGRPSELEDQCGAVVRLGREAGVPTPVCECLYASLLPQERRARGETEFADPPG